MDALLPLLTGGTTQFAPHGMCFLWTPILLWGMLTADLLIAASYYSIPVVLILFAYKHSISRYNHLLWKFSLFIFLCGTTHLIYIWNIWNSNYYLELTLKLLTGIVSFYVAIVTWKILPQALTIPSTDQLEKLNQQLAESEARYRELFETANEGVWLVDTSGRTQMANQAMADILGTSAEQLQQHSIIDFVKPQDREIFSQKLKQRLQGEKDKYEFILQLQDGMEINVLISSSPTYNKQGEVDGILGVITDLSDKTRMLKDLNKLNHELEERVEERTKELKTLNFQLTNEVMQREAALEKEKQANIRLDAVFNASPNGIIVTDINGIITEVNSSTQSMFGYRKSELLGKHVNILTPPEFADEHSKYIDNADISFTTKRLGFGRKLIAARRYESKFPVDIAITKIAINEQYYYMAVIRDLTEIDAVEEELRVVNEQLLHTVESLKEQSRETQLLNEYTEMLQSCQDLEDYPSIIDSYCASLFGSVKTTIYMVENSKLVKIGCDKSEEYTVQDCWALKSNRPYPTNIHQKRVPCKHLGTNNNEICLPLTAKGSTLGLIVIDTPKIFEMHNDSLPKELEQTIQALAVRTSISLANTRLLKEREELSYRDELTGLYNRRFMNETLRNYLPRARREKVAVTALMIDIDYFKKFNDQFGHNIGDNALAQVGHCIEQSMRETDLVGRLGGEEFLCVLYEATEEDGVNKAKIIHQAVSQINNLPLPITVSIGVAQSEPNDGVEDLIRKADIALYDAKQNGRDQTQRFTLHSDAFPVSSKNGKYQNNDKNPSV